jgi:hypothetical protein
LHRASKCDTIRHGSIAVETRRLNSPSERIIAMLAEKIIGTWELVSCVSRTPDGTQSHPQGPDLRGIIIYSADGFVSVNLMPPGRQRSSRAALAQVDDHEAGHLLRGYFAYAGPYKVDESAGVIHHDMDLCLDPGMIGTPQPREARFIDGMLELSVPMSEMNGTLQSVHLLWRRPG